MAFFNPADILPGGGSLAALGSVPQLSQAQLDMIRQKTPFGMGNDLANQYQMSQYAQTNPPPNPFANGFIPSRDNMNAFQDWSKQALNSPQPVPGMPWTPNEHWNDPGGGITGGAPVLGNRGSGQPISQPMATSQPLPWDGSGGQSSMGGSLQSLGGGMNQSGMVNLRGPDGSSQAVPQNDLAHWLSKGAVRV